MPKFAANLSMLFTELPFPERFAAAARAGFHAVEFLLPYAWDKALLQGLLAANGLELVLFNLPSGDWAAGERGIAADPLRTLEFRRGLDAAVEYALALGTPRLNCLAGRLPPGMHETLAAETLAENVAYAADRLARHGLTLLIEPINRFDMPDFVLHRVDQVEKIIGVVGRDNVAVQYDVYHAQREQGELAGTLSAHLARIGHIQIADNPGRHQPGTGEINFPFLFATMDRLGYDGYVGLEYVPEPDTAGSLAWLGDMGLRP